MIDTARAIHCSVAALREESQSESQVKLTSSSPQPCMIMLHAHLTCEGSGASGPLWATERALDPRAVRLRGRRKPFGPDLSTVTFSTGVVVTVAHSAAAGAGACSAVSPVERSERAVLGPASLSNVLPQTRDKANPGAGVRPTGVTGNNANTTLSSLENTCGLCFCARRSLRTTLLGLTLVHSGLTRAAVRRNSRAKVRETVPTLLHAKLVCLG